MQDIKSDYVAALTLWLLLLHFLLPPSAFSAFRSPLTMSLCPSCARLFSLPNVFHSTDDDGDGDTDNDTESAEERERKKMIKETKTCPQPSTFPSQLQ